MITPVYRIEPWSQGTKRFNVGTGICNQIIRNEADGASTIFEGFTFVADPFAAGILHANGGGPGVIRPTFGWVTLVETVTDERETRLANLNLTVATALAQNLGTPDPATIMFDLLVDGVSVLSAPVSLTIPSTGFKVALPLLDPTARIPGLTKVTVKYNVDWSGDEEEGGEYAPSFTNLDIVRA
jgi:hypothetical protein